MRVFVAIFNTVKSLASLVLERFSNSVEVARFALITKFSFQDHRLVMAPFESARVDVGAFGLHLL